MKLKSPNYYRRIYLFRRFIEIVVFVLCSAACAVLILLLLPMMDKVNPVTNFFNEGAPKIGMLYVVLVLVLVGICRHLIEGWQKRSRIQKTYDYIVGRLSWN